jgi:hypothetical protein
LPLGHISFRACHLRSIHTFVNSQSYRHCPHPNQSSTSVMGKGCPFRKAKHDHDVGSSRGGKKKVREHHYVPIDYTRLLFEENRTSVSFSTPGVCWLLRCHVRDASATIVALHLAVRSAPRSDLLPQLQQLDYVWDLGVEINLPTNC